MNRQSRQPGKQLGLTPRRRRALTLVEMMLSMSIMVVVVGGITSAVVIAARAIDDGSSPVTRTADAADAVAELAAETNFALRFNEISSKTIAFIVPDRDGDGKPESIRYTWSGVSGEPLTREYNGAAPANVVDEVEHFALHHLARTLTPPPQACCHPDGSCTELPMDACFEAGGEPLGRDSDCMSVTCPKAGNILLVVGDATTLSTNDSGRTTLLESWGFTVSLIDDNDDQANFDAAAAAADVVYVSGTSSGPTLVHKLTGTPTPVVNELAGKLDNFGFSSSTSATVLSDGFAQTDALHYITKPFSGNPVTVFHTYVYSMPVPGGTLAPDLQNVAEVLGTPTLVALDTGAQRFDGNPAPARRVHLPFGPAETAELTADGQTIMKRAIEWAGELGDGASSGAVCGDAECAPSEDSCSCPADCGTPPVIEDPDTTCNDGVDNDCDGVTDCGDANCASSFICTCGNGICQAREDCNNCSSDCASVTGGKPADRHCCGNGTLEPAEVDGSICDMNP